ncbi:MAG TPA: helix-turn-helix domain-containing protein, partial [Thermoanaerobaculia bacterium]|nr:helix-turn-helix domain-containing protein [Thermoanaerobaculia bacterium]
PDLGNEPLTRDAGSDAHFPVLTPDRTLKEILDEVERRLVAQALEEANGVQAEAARRLGVSRSDLAYKLKRLDMSVEQHLP